MTRPDMQLDLTTLALPPAWTVHALCAQIDHDGFFPPKGASSATAKKTCGMCSVRQQCLDYAVEHEEAYGVWGGLTPQQRKPLVLERRASGQVVCAFEDCHEVVDLVTRKRRYCSNTCSERAASRAHQARKAAS